MSRWHGALPGVLLAGLTLVSACGGGESGAARQTTSPSPVATEGTPLSSFGGTWTSGPGSGGVSSTNTCTGVQWRLPTMTGTPTTGTFSATCHGVRVSGTVTVAIGRIALSWRVAGRTIGQDGEPCPFALSGTAALERAGMRVEYEGTVCGTPVSGTDVWRRP